MSHKKSIIIGFCLLIFCFWPVAGQDLTPNPQEDPIQLGDINADTQIDIIDALCICHYYVGYYACIYRPDKADVDCSGIIDIVDALYIAQYYVNLINQFPCDNIPGPIQNKHFRAEVIGVGIDCGDTFLVEFLCCNQEIAELSDSEGSVSSSENIYYALNLPENAKQAGKIVVIQFRKPEPDEVFPCTMLGPAYTQIMITDAAFHDY